MNKYVVAAAAIVAAVAVGTAAAWASGSPMKGVQLVLIKGGWAEGVSAKQAQRVVYNTNWAVSLRHGAKTFSVSLKLPKQKIASVRGVAYSPTKVISKKITNTKTGSVVMVTFGNVPPSSDPQISYSVVVTATGSVLKTATGNICNHYVGGPDGRKADFTRSVAPTNYCTSVLATTR